MRLRPLLVIAVTLAPLAAPLRGFDFIGSVWPSGTIPLALQLDATRPASPAFPLLDGSAFWNAVASAALADWNAVVTRTKFTGATSAATTATLGNRVNNLLFSSTIYGDAFDSRTLAITTSRGDSSIVSYRTTESDVIVNTAHTWNSYRGPLRSQVDLRRVLIHELGHVLGLNHPDQADPAQSVASIMNSSVSSVDALQADDLAGAAALYNVPIAKPVITTQPQSAAVNVASPTAFTVAVDGAPIPASNPLRAYKWFFSPAGSSEFEELFTLRDSTRLDFSLAQLGDAGRYYFSSLTPDDTVNSDIVTLTVNPITVSPTTQLANVATRGVAGTGANAMIVGFVITGTKSKQVLLRAVGPGLAGFGVPGTLADPILTLKNSAGTTVTTNDNWEHQTEISASTVSANAARVGGFALTAGSKDSVILATLPPGGYTALVSSPDGSTGVVLLEAYDADAPLDPTLKLVNLSTRGYVGTGGDIIIAGFVVSGPGPKTFLIRAIGPTLLNSPFGLTGAVVDPYLKIYRGATLLRENDDWDSPAAAQPALRAAALQVGAFALRETRGTSPSTGLDAVMLITLPPGGYTAQMSGLDGLTGIGLVEVYEIP